MATGKKSFLLYCDIIGTVKKLPKEKAGELFMLILEYVNDKNPETEDLLLQVAFEPIKMQLKRDLVKYVKILEKRSLAGKASADKRQQVSTCVKSVQQTSTNSTDNVTVNVNDNVNDNKEILIDKIQKEFYNSLSPFLNEFKKDVLREFYNYWSEPNKSKTKIRWQMEKTWDTHKRLLRWVSNDFGKKKTEEKQNIKSSESELTKLYGKPTNEK
jgi:tRNA A37 N6-isopentenylltransferase MiaA